MKDNKLGIMPISKLIWNMSLPIIVSMLVQALYNIVDSVFVSQVSEQALTAVTLAFPAQNLMIGLATGTAVGVNALLGRALGAGDGKRADQVAINGIFLAVVGFVLSAVLALCFGGTFFRTQTDIDYIVDNGITYLRICCCASLAPAAPSSPCIPRGWAPSSTSCWTPSSSSCSKWAWWVPLWPPLSASSAAAVWPCI